MQYPFNDEFQKKLIKYLIFENKTEFLSYLDETSFDTYELKEIFKFSASWVAKNSNMPSYDALRAGCGGIFLQGDDLPPLKVKILEAIDDIEKAEIMGSEIRVLLLDFVKAQQQRILAIKMGDDFERGVYKTEEYANHLHRLLYLDNLDRKRIVFSEYKLEMRPRVERIPTHLSFVNHWLKGGLERGELGIVFAQANLGKSFFLVCLGAQAYDLGKYNIFYYTLELSDFNVMLRFASNITGYSADNLTGEGDKWRFKFEKKLQESKKGPGNIFINEFPTRGATVNDINSDIRFMYSERGIKPDLILIDYADLIRPMKWYDDDHERVAEVIESCRRLAGEQNAAVWTVSQIKSDKYGEELTLNSGARSIRKAEVADVVLGMFGDPKVDTQAYIKLLKLRRAGKPGIQKKLVYLDYDRSKMTDKPL